MSSFKIDQKGKNTFSKFKIDLRGLSRSKKKQKNMTITRRAIKISDKLPLPFLLGRRKKTKKSEKKLLMLVFALSISGKTYKTVITLVASGEGKQRTRLERIYFIKAAYYSLLYLL